MIQFPFLVGAVFSGWLVPQLINLTSNVHLPTDGLAKTILMAILCLAAAWWGYVANRRPAQIFDWKFSYSRLLWSSAAMSLVGVLSFYKVSLLAPTVAGSPWSGSITVHVFLGTFLTCGMAIALLLYLAKPSWSTALIFSSGLIFYLDRIVLKGRRAAMVELGLMVLTALWFRRRWVPPRWALVATLLIGALLVNSIGEYRSVMLAKDQWSWSQAGASRILEIDFIGNFHRLINGESPSIEATNALMNIEAVDRQLAFDFGLSHWDALVHRLVPAQFVGPAVKEALLLQPAGSGPVSVQATREFGYAPTTVGSTATGLSDSFRSFWYFGAMNFLIIGLIMSRWYQAAERGHFVAQIVVLLTLTASLQAVTHSTHWFFVQCVQLTVLLLPILLLARIKRRPFSITRHSRFVKNVDRSIKSVST